MFGPREAIFAAALIAAGLCASAAAAGAPKTLADKDVPKIVDYALKHKGSLGPYAGKELRVMAQFSHMDRQGDDAVGKRTDGARSFEVILAVTPPPGFFDLYVGCLLPPDSLYAKEADAAAGGQVAPELQNGAFVLDGELETYTFLGKTYAGQLELKRGCTVSPP